MNKTEHAGAKKGRGGFYGPKRIAKQASDKRRRREGKQAARESGRASRKGV
jgi:hypothetical protein